MTRPTISLGQDASLVGVAIDPSVNQFVGIPFALPPVGENRWKHPRKLPANFFRDEKPYDATQFKDICFQPPTPLPHDPDSDQHANVNFPTSKADLVL
jgi:carboxylesterase type B